MSAKGKIRGRESMYDNVRKVWYYADTGEAVKPTKTEKPTGLRERFIAACMIVGAFMIGVLVGLAIVAIISPVVAVVVSLSALGWIFIGKATARMRWAIMPLLLLAAMLFVGGCDFVSDKTKLDARGDNYARHDGETIEVIYEWESVNNEAK